MYSYTEYHSYEQFNELVTKFESQTERNGDQRKQDLYSTVYCTVL